MTFRIHTHAQGEECEACIAEATAAERDAVVALLKQWDYSRLAQHIESGVHITEPTAQAGYRKRSIALVDTVELAPEANDE